MEGGPMNIVRPKIVNIDGQNRYSRWMRPAFEYRSSDYGRFSSGGNASNPALAQPGIQDKDNPGKCC